MSIIVLLADELLHVLSAVCGYNLSGKIPVTSQPLMLLIYKTQSNVSKLCLHRG